MNHNLDVGSYEYRKNYLNHEYGHILQERLMGSVGYLLKICLPSMLFNLISRGENSVGKFVQKNYYNLPWEYSADVLGSVKRQHTEQASGIAIAYFVLF